MPQMHDSNLSPSKIAFVLANGPSAKLLNFQDGCFGFAASVGMNSAFRYWDKINFRPSHYICMDIEVIETIAKDIVGLIKENRIQKFFLRDELKELHPEISDDERILWYSNAREKSDLFDNNYVTTGSWAIRWMLYEGMQCIATIGIDGVQTEILPEAKRLGTGSDIRLQIVDTPKFNPNYFFAEYQQAGDKYNIPNSPSYLKAKGNLFHIDALKAILSTTQRMGIEAKIYDLSPISNHGLFEKISYSSFIRKIGIPLVACIQSENGKGAIEDALRAAVINCENPVISKVHLLIDCDEENLTSALPLDIKVEVERWKTAGKLNFFLVDQMTSLKTLFDFANTHGDNYSYIISSPDIVVPYATAEKIVIERFDGKEPLYAMTGSGLPDTYSARLNPSSSINKRSRSLKAFVVDQPFLANAILEEINVRESDCYTLALGIFRALDYPIRINEKEFPLISMGNCKSSADNALTHSARAEKALTIFKNSILQRFRSSPSIVTSLNNGDLLTETVGWIGSPGNGTAWEGLYYAASTPTWRDGENVSSLKFKKIAISATELAAKNLDVDGITSEISLGSTFIEWELTAFKDEESFVEMLLQIDEYRVLGALLLNYPWQSFIYVDKASPEIRVAHADFVLAAQDLLSPKASITLEDKQKQKLTYIKTYKYGNVHEQQGAFLLAPPAQKNHVACSYSGAVHPGDRTTVTVEFNIDQDCTLRFILCRDGDTSFESANEIKSLLKGWHSITLRHVFKRTHSGLRIQIGCDDKPANISGIRTSLNIDTDEHAGLSTSVISSRNQNIADHLVIIDPDGKNIRGHFLAYCDQLKTACKEIGTTSEVWCRKDIDPSLLNSRPDFRPLLNTHSWTIATNENKVFAEFEGGILQYIQTGKKYLLYLYTGSLHHTRIFLNLSRKYPQLQFNCNLFWEMIRDIHTPEYIKLSEEVFGEIKKHNNVTVTVPTVSLQADFEQRFNIRLPVAPHPSTAVPDDLFLKIQRESAEHAARAGKTFNVLFPGAATQNKGYEVSLEVAAKISSESDIVCWVRDEKKGGILPSFRLIPDNLSNEEFNGLIQSADALVLPYMPDGFRKRTSGILIDAMYFGVPVVVCSDTWLGEITEHYEFGIATAPTCDGLTKALMTIKANPQKYRKAARAASVSYFREHSWEKLAKFLICTANAVGVSDSAGKVKCNLAEANQLLQKGEYLNALRSYIYLYKLRKLKMYENNALLCARRLQWKDMTSIQDIEKRLTQINNL